MPGHFELENKNEDDEHFKPGNSQVVCTLSPRRHRPFPQQVGDVGIEEVY